MEQPPQSATPPANTAPSPDLAELQKKLDEAETAIAAAARQAEEYLNGWKRAKADYQNLKRESEVRSWQQAKTAVSSFAENLWTDFYCNVLPAFEHIPHDQRGQPWVEGLHNSIRQFEAVIKRLGFEPLQPEVGKPFNPLEHEAVAADEQSSQPDNTIVAVIRPGLKCVDDEMRVVPAHVKVAHHKEA